MSTRSQEIKSSVDLNKVLVWARRQMRTEGTGVLSVIYEATDKFGLSANQVLAISSALGQEGWK
jgi:hypothetical protein